MSNASTFAISPSTQSLATTPFIANVTCTLAATEYSFIFPANTKGFTVGPRRGGGELQYAYVSGDTNVTFISVPRGTFRATADVNITAPLTLYFQAALAGTIVEIEYWT